MLYKDFYREPVAQLLWHSPIILAELASRNCYDSYFLLDIDFVSHNIERFYGMFQTNHEIVRLLDMIRDNNIDSEEIKRIKPMFVKELLMKNPSIIINESKPNIDFIRKVGIDKNHASVLEHINLSFRLEFPRNVLQEISRHRIGVSPSIKSTRYTLTALKKKFSNYIEHDEDHSLGLDIEKYLHENYGIKDNDIIQSTNIYMFKVLKMLSSKNDNFSNDYIKNILPEHWWSVGNYTINLTAFKHMMDLRLSSSAFMPFRRLAYNMFNSLPVELKGIFKDDYDEMLADINNKWENQEV